MKNYLPVLLIGLVLVSLIGCGCPTVTPSSTPISQPTSIPIGEPTLVPTETGSGGDQTPGFVQSSKARVTSIDIPASDQVELVGGNSAFAFDLYHLLKEEEENLFLLKGRMGLGWGWQLSRKSLKSMAVESG